MNALGQVAGSESEAASAAMLRAYPLERCVDYGCSIDDALALHRRVAAGMAWHEAAVQLAQDNMRRADAWWLKSARPTAWACTLHAAACLRLAQSGMEDMPQRRAAVYAQQRDAFSRGLDLGPGASVLLNVAHGGVRHCCWLFPAAPLSGKGRPCVLVWGGADGWCEAFHGSVQAFLERGIAVCLVELPGQGLARLSGQSLLRTDYLDMVSSVLDALAAMGLGAQGFGVVGHSLGGSLALAAAAADSRFVACCTNGGSVRPQIGLARYPRVLQRVGRMLGDASTSEQTLEFIERLQLPQAARTMRAALLCLQGGQDALVADGEVSELVALRGVGAATLRRWPEGTHCLYNFAFERNAVMADWFASQWAGAASATVQTSRKAP